MSLKVLIAGATGWTGAPLVEAVVAADDLERPARRIGLADDAEPRQALADVDLDAHWDAGGPQQAGGRDGSEHVPSLERLTDRGGATGPTT